MGEPGSLLLLNNMVVAAQSEGNNMLCSAVTEQCFCFPCHRRTINPSHQYKPTEEISSSKFQTPRHSGSRDREIKAWSLNLLMYFFSLMGSPGLNTTERVSGEVGLVSSIFLHLCDSYYPINFHLHICHLHPFHFWRLFFSTIRVAGSFGTVCDKDSMHTVTDIWVDTSIDSFTQFLLWRIIDSQV